MGSPMLVSERLLLLVSLDTVDDNTEKVLFQENRFNQIKWLSDLGSDTLYSTKKQTCREEMNVP